MKAFVYFNLHKKCWSVRDEKTKRVAAHSDTVTLLNVEFKISKAGRERVLREKRKNVHAGVKGELYSIKDDPPGIYIPDLMERAVEVTYNPYKYETFVRKSDGKPIKGASLVFMKKGKVFVCPDGIIW